MGHALAGQRNYIELTKHYNMLWELAFEKGHGLTSMAPQREKKKKALAALEQQAERGHSAFAFTRDKQLLDEARAARLGTGNLQSR